MSTVSVCLSLSVSFCLSVHLSQSACHGTSVSVCLSRSLGLSVSVGQDTRTNAPTMSIMQCSAGRACVRDVDSATAHARRIQHREYVVESHIHLYQPSKSSVKHSTSRADIRPLKLKLSGLCEPPQRLGTFGAGGLMKGQEQQEKQTFCFLVSYKL